MAKAFVFVCVAALAILWATFAVAETPCAWAAQESPGLHAGGAISVGTADDEYAYEKNAEYVIVSDKTAGTVGFNPATRVLSVNGVKATSIDVHLPSGPVTISLSGNSNIDSFYVIDTAVTIKGSGSLTGTFETSTDAGIPLTIAGAKIIGQLNVGVGLLVMSGGVLEGAAQVDGPITIKGGTIKGSSVEHGIVCTSFTMTSGLVSFNNAEYGITVDGDETKSNDFVMSGGKIVLNNSEIGINLSGGNLTLSGGAIEVTSANEEAVWVGSNTYDGKEYGGKVKLTGGTLVAINDNPDSGSAVYAVSMKNKLGTLKSIAGSLPTGATFISGKNTYKVTDSECVTLVKYGAKAKKVTINKMKFGQCPYAVTGISTNAFNTKAGKKVKSITIKSPIKKIAAKAFAGTKSLKLLKFTGSAIWITGKQKKVTGKMNEWYQYVSFKAAPGISISKRAFVKMGKNGGKGLTLRFVGFNDLYDDEKPLFNKFMKSKGVSAKVKVKTS